MRVESLGFRRTTRRSLVAIAAGVGLGAGFPNSAAHGTPVASPASREANPVEVEIDLGVIRGRDFGEYTMYQGIPYAEPPTGDLRWAAPVPVEEWDEPLDAFEPGSPAPQVAQSFAGVDSTDEDCLYLNVTTPAGTSTDVLKPVMVWIHGGGGANGSGDIFQPQRLVVEEGVVVVTFNYRLGIFGAFGWPGLDNSGVFGLLDQQLALHWVKEHISAFGGDPDNVMLFGESYGALAVSGHLVSPRAEGLFHRAAIQSGLGLIDYPPDTFMPGTDEIPSMWISNEELAGLSGAIVGELDIAADVGIELLRELPVDLLLPLSSIFTRYGWGENDVLPEDPVPLLQAGEVHDVPVISGSTRDEARLFVGLFFDLADQPVTEESYPELMSSAFGDAAAQVEEEYPLSDFESPSLAWATVVTDRVWATATMEQNRGLAQNVPTWAYQFADREAPPVVEFPERLPPGAYHSAEVGYQFDYAGEESQLSESQLELAGYMNRYWANFARSGDPNGEVVPEWPVFDGGDIVQSFDDGEDGIGQVDYVEDHRLVFWEALEAEVATPEP